MGRLSVLATRLATLIILHAAGAGLASPTVLVTRPISRIPLEWLPADNQTVYRLAGGETKSLELNSTSTFSSVTPVFITVSPCTRDFRWAIYYGKSHNNDEPLRLLKEYSGRETNTFTAFISQQDRYVLQVSSSKGGAAAVSVRGEATRTVRMRLRVKSRRRLIANWDPSPIDPQATTYCVVASQIKNYSSLCEAQFDIKTNRLESKSNRFSENDRFKTEVNRYNPVFNRLNTTRYASREVNNKIDINIDSFGVFEGDFKSVYRRKKFGRSTKVTDEDPVIACVGERTHHLIENLDPSTTYYVSVFGVAKDRRAGALLATGTVRPRTSTAKRLRENVPYKSDIKGKTIYYFKTTVGSGGELWLTISTCGGSVDIEVLVRGKRLYYAKNIETHSKFFVPGPIPTSSIQETSEESSVQFDSSSEEARIRYVIKVVPNRWDKDASINIEIVASSTRWGINTPELLEEGSVVRELRPRRSCRSVDIAFLPATHNATDVIRYCVTARESIPGENYTCISKKSSGKTQCINRVHHTRAKVIVQKVSGLRPGSKYAIQVTASVKGSSVPYNVLYVDTNLSCKEE